ncbi:histidine triad nucleotide-binding protein [Spartinivicinus ruber]|uniref:histidine triad nucleotide-binding protein n=1 Tax=Spartinivicinus ruber TaxID=2683272 RepID=UPI0013D1C146|nr:histidine triad nucleotide-binding protein [Spartinivicinus ruber]
MDCLFCKIAAGEIPSNKVYEDEQIYAFHDINPGAPTHFLIIPKQHIATLNEASTEHQTLLGHMQLMASKLCKEMGLAEEGYRTVINCNKQAGQTIFHIHLHVLGGRALRWPPG